MFLIVLYSKKKEGKEQNNCMFPFRGTLCRLLIENQPIASKILTQTSRYKRAESNLLADEKGPQHRI